MPPTLTSRHSGNRLFDRIPGDEYDRLMSAAQTVALRLGHQVYRRYGPVTHAYFPIRGMFSVVVNMEGGKQAEAATVGNEGMLGLPAYLGLDFSPNAVIVQLP